MRSRIDVCVVAMAVTPEKENPSRCMLVGAAIISATFALDARFIGRLFAWRWPFGIPGIFAVGFCCNWVGFNWNCPISRFRRGILYQIFHVAC